MSTLTTELTAPLEALGLSPTRSGDDLRVSHGRGRLRRHQVLDLEPLRRFLEGNPQTDRRRALSAFARGAYGVLNEPSNSDAADWAYVDCAGRLTPSIEYLTFEHGALAAGGGRPWLVDFGDDLSVVYHIELDRGARTLAWPQFLAWGVTPDRITSASRSLLYYKTAQDALAARFEPDPPSGGFFYKLGDGHDAARALILSDLDYHRTRRGLIFAVPHADILLIKDKTDDAEALARFQQAVKDAYAVADAPLSTLLFTYEDARTLRPLRP